MNSYNMNIYNMNIYNMNIYNMKGRVAMKKADRIRGFGLALCGFCSLREIPIESNAQICVGVYYGDLGGL